MTADRQFEFRPTAAVAASRSRSRYVDCSLCEGDYSEYLFFRTGVRFVRCRRCGLVYVNPVGGPTVNYFDIERTGPLVTARDRELLARDFEAFLADVVDRVARIRNAPPQRTLLLGRWLPEFEQSDAARRASLEIARADDDAFQRLSVESDVAWAGAALGRSPDLVILHELLEACSNPRVVLERLTEAAGPQTVFAVTYSNVDSLPARMMRRHWQAFFDYKASCLSTQNLTALMARAGYSIRAQLAFPTTRTLGYLTGRVAPRSIVDRACRSTPLGTTATPFRSGHRIALFTRGGRTVATDAGEPREKLSIIFPVYNEAQYVEQVLETVLAKPLRIDKEVVVVESNSTDGSRDIIRRFEGRPGVRVIYEDEPRGKGHAVRTGLAAVTGTIVLIQDADFEYDIDDYDALLEPLLQHKTAFVLGSRTLGLDDWKVRQFARGPVRRLLLNSAQVLFAETFNALYQQRITDVNTMFKVFRVECLEGLDLESDGFDLDIELACKLVKNGFSALEVPVNYVARGFDEGKKISFLRDAYPSYAAFFRYRFR